MVTHSMCIAIVAITWDSEHENALVCLEACYMNIDLNYGSVGLQRQKPGGLRSKQRQKVCLGWSGYNYAEIRIKIDSTFKGLSYPRNSLP